MITITNKTILDYLVKEIIKEKRATPNYIQIDNGDLRITWRNGKVTTRNIFSSMYIKNNEMVLSLYPTVDFNGGEIARITYVISKITH